MFIIWIGWLYVVLMLAVAQNSIIRSGLVLVLLGVLPSLLLLFIVRRRQQMKAAGLIEPRRKKKKRPVCRHRKRRLSEGTEKCPSFMLVVFLLGGLQSRSDCGHYVLPDTRQHRPVQILG